MTKTKALLSLLLQTIAAWLIGVNVILFDNLRIAEVRLLTVNLRLDDIESLNYALLKSPDYDPADVAFKHDEDEEDELPPRKVSTR
jgi:hypothetical protein